MPVLAFPVLVYRMFRLSKISLTPLLSHGPASSFPQDKFFHKIRLRPDDKWLIEDQSLGNLTSAVSASDRRTSKQALRGPPGPSHNAGCDNKMAEEGLRRPSLHTRFEVDEQFKEGEVDE